MLNAGAPLHVVQRYLGHLSPEMTMRYAATLASTAEREFLAMVKIGRDGREIGMDRRDMLDLMQLDRRTDRILPNGYCLLPPVRSCDKGNACHGCDHFATDKTYLPEIRRQLAETEQLIEQRKAQHLARYGEPMSENNVWLEQRLAEVRSMRLEIAALQAQPAGDTGAVRGAGVCGRPGYQPGPVPVTISRKPSDRDQGPLPARPAAARQHSRAAPGRCPAPRRPGQAAGRHGPRRGRDPQARQESAGDQLPRSRPHRRSQPGLPLRQRRSARPHRIATRPAGHQSPGRAAGPAHPRPTPAW